MLIDTHCHLTYPELATQLDEVVQRAAAAGVQRIITIATSVSDAEKALKVVQTHPRVSMAAGIHPHEAGKCTSDDLQALGELHRSIPGNITPDRDRNSDLVAVGETGLDFHYDFAPPDQQERIFRAQLDIALDVDRPVIIHARKSEERVCDVLSDYPALSAKVVFHCYSADLTIARRILDMGNYLSFTGVVTFANADTVQEVAKFVPGDRFMVETDAPYLSPVPVRKIRPNEPAFAAHTARFLAELRGEPFESLAVQTTANAVRFFSLPEVEI